MSAGIERQRQTVAITDALATAPCGTFAASMKSAPGTWTTLHTLPFDSLTSLLRGSTTATPSTSNM